MTSRASSAYERNLRASSTSSKDSLGELKESLTRRPSQGQGDNDIDSRGSIGKNYDVNRTTGRPSEFQFDDGNSLADTGKLGFSSKLEKSNKSLYSSKLSEQMVNFSNEILECNRSLLSWNNINYWVPINKSAQVKFDRASEGLPPEDLRHTDKKTFKRVVHEASGYVRPKEMVAIMGPSGSGKTSLLNVLSQRISLSGGSFVEGEYSVNGRQLSSGDFGNFGAFVQQDDVLTATMTVRELFEFAGRIRLNLEPHALDHRVNKIIDMLGLTACENNIIGGWLLRGISGGERKRTSIGYELITEPSLLLLDEPTSGLDSSTSVKICSLLKDQAARGMSVLATIHQPSTKIFTMFDRVIVLSEGYTIYNGPPCEVMKHFNQFGLKMSQYVNPADKLSIIASKPRYLLNPEVTIEQLHEHCLQVHKKYLGDKDNISDFKEVKMDRRFSLIGANRKVPFFTEFMLIFKREMMKSRRNPISIIFLICMGVMQGLLQASIFGGIGDDRFDPKDMSVNSTIVSNLLGLAYLITSDQLITCSFGQVLAIPQNRPVFDREISNHMFRPTSYYMAVQLTSTINLVLYPFVVLSTAYCFFDFIAQSWSHYVHFYFVLAIAALIGSNFGLMIGTFMKNEVAATGLCYFSIMAMSFGSGLMVNTAHPNPFVKFLTWVSPMRYATELTMRQVIAGRNEQAQETVLEFLGYNYGEAVCVWAMLGFMVLFFVTGWVVLVRKASQMA